MPRVWQTLRTLARLYIVGNAFYSSPLLSSLHVSGINHFTHLTSLNAPNIPVFRDCYYPHFTDEKTEAQVY